MDRDRFLENLVASHLVDEPALGRLLEASPEKSAAELARQLVAQRLLTQWQAGQLLSGRCEFVLGKYRLLSELGRGGMGAVFQAEQLPLGRIVALKVMATHLVKDATAVARFRREIQAAAALTHPNIVTAIDADHVGNTHFLVMEYVEGESLSEILNREGRLPAALACEYVRQAAEGLQHACEQGMVHRDIKPSNLLVTPALDGEAVVKILDLGLARFTTESHAADELTATGQVMGTPDYVAPEQARSTKTADIRSDIFSLGCTLFRAVSGVLPYGGDSVMEKLMARGMSDAPRLSTVDPTISPELDDIVARMLERDPARRFQSPREIARALAPLAVKVAQPGTIRMTSLAEGQAGRASPARAAASDTAGHFPIDETVVSRETAVRAHTSARRAGDRRTTLLFTAGGLVLAALIAALWYWQKSGEAVVVVRWPESERTGATLQVDGRSRTPPRETEFRLVGPPGRRTLRMSREGYEPVSEVFTLERGAVVPFQPQWKPTPETLVRNDWDALRRSLEDLAPKLPEDLPTALASAEVRNVRGRLAQFLRRAGTAPEAAEARTWLARLPWPADGISAQSVPDVERKLTGWSTDDAQLELVAVLGQHRSPHALVRAARISPDGSRLVSVGSGGIALWSFASATPVSHASLELGMDGVFLNDHEFLAVGIDVTVWSLGEGSLKLERTLPCPEWAEKIALHPDRQHLAVACRDQTIRFYNLTGPEPREQRVIATGGIHANALAYADAGRLLIVGDHDHHLTAYDLSGDQPALKWRVLAHADWVYDIAVSPDDTRLASAGAHDLHFKLWDLTTTPPTELGSVSTGQAACSVTFSSNGQQLVGGLWDGSAVLWNLATSPIAEAWRVAAHSYQVWALALSPDGTRLVTGGEDGRVRQWDLSTGRPEEQHRPTGHNGPVTAAAISRDGQTLATGGADGTILMWDLGTGQQKDFAWKTGSDRDLAFPDDGQVLAAGDNSGRVRLCDLSTGAERPERLDFPADITGLAYLPTSRILAIAGGVPELVLWDASQPSESTIVPFPNRKLAGLSASPEGGRLVLGSDLGDISVWDVRSRKEIFPVDLSGSRPGAVACLPDGRSIAVGHGAELLVWDLEQRATVRKAPSPSLLLAVSETGELATAGNAHDVGLWSAALEGTGFRLGAHAHPLRDLVFSPEGRHLVTANHNGTLYVVRRGRWSPPGSARAR